MKFYIFAFLLAYFQSSALIALFHSFLFVPNLLLVYFFLELARDEGYGLKRALFSGFFLDLLQDSLGLNLFGYTLFTLMVNAIKTRFEFAHRFSFLFAYALFSSIEKLFIFLLFRLKYFLEFNLWLTLLGFFTELGFLLFLLKWYHRKET